MLCIVCKVEKTDNEFNWRNKQLDIRKNHCRVCDREMRKRSYEKHKEKSILAVRDRTNTIKEQFRQWKSTLNCQICSETEEVCLDFHHIDPTTKEAGVAKLLERGSKLQIIQEINKCVVLCACCHRKVHKYGWDVVSNGATPNVLSVDAALVFNGQHTVLPSRG